MAKLQGVSRHESDDFKNTNLTEAIAKLQQAARLMFSPNPNNKLRDISTGESDVNPTSASSMLDRKP